MAEFVSASNRIICGESAEVLKDFDADSIDCIVTDPPYGWEFMGKGWDAILPAPIIWKRCLRVLKPGALAFIMCGARTDGLWRMGRDIEEAGFELSLQPILWCYNSGFPKALDISKDFDKAAFTGWVADKHTKIVCPFAHKHKRLAKRKVDCPECKRITWAFREGYMDELTLAHIRKAASAAVNGQYFNPAARKKSESGITYKHNGQWVDMGMNPDRTEGTILLSSLVARFWEPLLDLQRLHIWKEYSVKALRESQQQEFAIGPDHQDLSLPPGVRVKVGEITEFGYPDGGTAYLKNRQYSNGSQVATGGTVSITAPSVDDAKTWDGYKSHALKPAYEVCIVARKPMSEKPIRENVKRWGVGGYNIEAGRIPFGEGQSVRDDRRGKASSGKTDGWFPNELCNYDEEYLQRSDISGGRFPANLISSDGAMGADDRYFSLDRWAAENGFDEDWTAQAKAGLLRIAKPAKKEKTCGGEVENQHSTVKPVALFGWLLALGCPPGMLMLDPFVGSGSSCVAAIKGGWQYIGIDQDEHYCEISRARTAYVKAEQKQHTLDLTLTQYRE